MPLNKFGAHSGVSISRFAKHFHEHNLSKHLARAKPVVRDFKQKWVLLLSGVGKRMKPTNPLLIIDNIGYYAKYTNLFYKGKIKDSRLSRSVHLYINDQRYNPGDDVTLKSGDILTCQANVSSGTVPFVVELLIEEL